MDGTAPTVGEVLDGLRALGEGLPFNQHMGVEIRRLEVGYCQTALPPDGRLDNHLGGVHAIAELAPVELAGAMAASSRLAPLIGRGYVPVVAGLSVRYLAAARGELTATADVPEAVLDEALAAERAGQRPRVEVEVQVADPAQEVVAVTTLYFVYLSPDEVAAAG